MKLKDVKSKIDQYFDNISPEEFYKTLIQYHMKKTIFEGTINGEKFDNVVDYNKRMQELLGQGIHIEASSNTRTIDEPTEAPTATKDMIDSGRMYPGFETMTLSEGFIEKALEHDSENIVKSLNEYIETNVLPAIGKMTREDLGTYLSNLDKILAHLGKLERKNENAIDDVDGELKELNEKLDDCSNRLSGYQAIGGVLDVFNKAYSDLKEHAISAASKKIQGCTCNGCSCGHPDPAGAQGPSGTQPDPLTGLLKLVREIFDK